MKKVRYLLFLVISMIVTLTYVNAASFNVTSSSKSVIVGNTFKVTVAVSGSDVAGWEYCVNYDTNKLTLVSATTSTGSTCEPSGVDGFTSKTATFTFKAKASGTSTISLSSAAAYNWDLVPVSSTKGSVSITARTQAEIEASYSTNADLKGITVDEYELDPVFKKDVLEYKVEVPNEVESVNVAATKDDSKAMVSGTGVVELTEGLNKVTIIVTAEKGNKKEYVVNITRKELDPINVNFEGNQYSVVRKVESLETYAPNYYNATTTIVDGIEVPAFKSDITNYILIGLKDNNGDIKLYRYDENDSKIYKYVQYNQEGFTFVLEEATSLLQGYELTKEITIGEDKVIAYYKEDGVPNYVLVYGMNARTGVKDWYQYDMEDGTFQRFQNKDIIKLQEDLKDYYLLVIVFAVGLGLSILLIIILLASNSSKKRKNVKLLAMLENGEVVEKNYVAIEVEKDDEGEVEEAEEPKKKAKKSKNKKEVDQQEEETEKLSDDVVVFEEPEEEEIIEEEEEVVTEHTQVYTPVKVELDDEDTQEIEINDDDILDEVGSIPKKVKEVDNREKPKTTMSRRQINRLQKQKEKDLEEMANKSKTRSQRKSAK